MLSRRAFAAGVTLAAGAALSRVSEAQARALGEPERFTDPATRDPLSEKAARRAHRVRDPQRRLAAVADERRCEGVPPRRRAGRARARTRLDRAPVGLQRQLAGAHDRSDRGRQGPHLRHQQAARAHHDPLARHPAALGHGRGRGLSASRKSSRARPSSTSSCSGRAGPSCTTRTPTRWCRWGSA